MRSKSINENWQRVPCQKEDISRLNSFIKESTGFFPEKVNWFFERLNFSYTMSRHMNGVSEERYRECIAIWQRGEKILSAVITEGENRGEAFFLLSSPEPEEDILEDMFCFVKENLMLYEEGVRSVHLRISSRCEKIREKAHDLGYRDSGKKEITSKKELSQKEVVTLPPGYRIARADEYSFEELALVHGKAFGYSEREELLGLSKAGLQALAALKEYNPVYDLVVVDEQNIPAAFATLWFDEINKIGILEPVGTTPDQRRKGLARAVINHGCNLLHEQGAKSVYVGSDQDFYKALGFDEVSCDDIYTLEESSLPE